MSFDYYLSSYAPKTNHITKQKSWEEKKHRVYTLHIHVCERSVKYPGQCE